MSPRRGVVSSVVLLWLVSVVGAQAKPQNFEFNALTDGGNPFVVQAQPVPEGGKAPVPVINGRPVSGAAALLAGQKNSKYTQQYSSPPLPLRQRLLLQEEEEEEHFGEEEGKEKSRKKAAIRVRC